MKKFSEKIYESMMDKDPIDPSEDVKEYRIMFPVINNDYVENNLKNIESSHPTMTDTYNVYVFNPDSWSNPDVSTYSSPFDKYVRAVSSEHALIRMAISFPGKEFRVNFVTNQGYYFDKEKDKNILINAKEVDVDSLIKKYEKEIDCLKNPI
jgi:hypothetical protein